MPRDSGGMTQSGDGTRQDSDETGRLEPYREQTAHLTSETQRQIARSDNLPDIYRLVGREIQALIGDGYVGVSTLDEKTQQIRIVGTYGFGSLYENLVRIFRVDPSKYVYYVKDITADELRLFRSGKLERFEGGLYHLLVRRVPKAICDAVEKELHLTGIYTMGFVWQNLHFGGLTILAKHDITPLSEMIETVINQATISMRRLKSEEALRESEERYRDLIDASNDWIWEVDRNGAYTYASSRVRDVLGYEPEELLGKTPFDLMPADEAKRIAQAFAAIVARQEPFRGLENVNRHKDGHLVVVETNGLPFFGEDGNLSGYRGLDRDITERKRLEEQFRQAQKMEAVGRLAGGVAHDFNNLLTVIQGHSQLALRLLPKGHPVQEDIEEVLHAAERAASLTQQLLAFSRRQILEPRMLDLNVVLQGLSKMLPRLIGEDITVQMNLDKSPVTIKADPGQIEQVAINLAVNARDAMPTGGTLTFETANVVLDGNFVSQHPGAQAGDYAVLTVRDTGFGMDSGVKEHLFEPFFTTKEVGQGTGLGLATVFGIVKQSGGDIYVDSEPGKGSAFHIYLPRTDDAPVVLRAPTAVSTLPRGKERILVVEDQTEVRQLAIRMLRSLGYQVLEAARPSEAITLCQAETKPIQLVLTDVVMPEMRGPQLVEKLRQVRQDFTVLYMSGYVDEAIARPGPPQEHGDTPPLGGVTRLQKPFTLEDLAHKVREVLDRQTT